MQPKTQNRNVAFQKLSEVDLLQELIDLIPDPITVKDCEGKYAWVNHAKARELGARDFGDVIGKTAFDFFDRAMAERFQREEDQILKTGQPIINRRENVSVSGGSRWHLTSKIPWRDGAGKIIGLMAIAADITEQVEAEMKLQKERNLLRTLIDNLPDAIYAKNADAQKIMVNEADLKNLGCKDEADAFGKTDFDIFPKETAEAFFADDQAVLKDGKSIINREEKMLLKNGETHWLLTSKIPWRDDSGNIIGLIGIGRDITDKKNLEAQLLRAQRMESIGRLSTGIAHDLNNILAPILISTTLLRQKITDEEGLKILSNVEVSAKRGAEIIKQVLLFGRGIEGQRIAINLKYFIREIARITTEPFGQFIQVDLQIADDVCSIMADPSQLYQVLLNLSLNARDAMPSGGKLTFAVRNFTVDAGFAAAHAGACAGRCVILEVTDTGHGIPDENLDRIFEPFFTTKQIGRGAGLGLSTVLSIVKSHGGFILVKSIVGKGSTFQIYLPTQPEQN